MLGFGGGLWVPAVADVPDNLASDTLARVARSYGYTCLSGDPRFLRIAASVGWNDHVVGAKARQDPDKVTVTVRAVDPEPPDQF
ncbi:MAG: hypothetical protein M3O80_00150, partial [Chloroflexota bacterium]|nr:hypothetical protein [Chloroflexota bacterium]